MTKKQRVENNKLNHMVAFAEASHCRRQILLRYFDEICDSECGYCDVCDNPPITEDKTEDAQKFLSCIYRLKQNYGMLYTIEILRASSSEKIKRAGHDMLSTYGIGKNQSANYWKQLAWQLIHRDYCYQDISHFNVLRLSQKAIAILKGSEKVMLALPNMDETTVSKKSKEKIKSQTKNNPLFEALRILRRQIAEEENKPPFMIFSDNTLLEMASKKPQTLDEFLDVSGVGQHKLSHYGLRFLKELRTNTSRN